MNIPQTIKKNLDNLAPSGMLLALFFWGMAYLNTASLAYGPMGRWEPYLILLAVATALILCLPRTMPALIPWDSKIVRVLMAAVAILVLVKTIHIARHNLGFMNTANTLPAAQKILWVSGLLMLGVWLAGFRRVLRGDFFQLILLLMIALGSMQFRYISETARNQPWIFLLIAGLVVIASRAFRPDEKATGILPKLAIHLLFLPVLCAWAFRTDYLFIEGALYHTEYFFGPVTTLKAGEALLLTQPSQYGFLNILLPALLPLGDALKSFHLYHGLLLLVVANMMPLAFLKRSGLAEYAFLFAACVITLFFTDPGAVGPNGFPSSSVVRFFPAFLLVLALQYKGKDWFRTVYVMPFFVMFIGALWNFEGFFYVAVGAGFLVCSHLANPEFSFREKQVIAAKGVGLVALSCLSAILVANLYTWYITGAPANLDLYWMHPFVYVHGLGAVPLDPFGPQLLILIPIGVYMLSRYKVGLRPVECALIGCALTLLSYYYGRSVPNNLEAMYPPLFLICLLLFRGAPNHDGRRMLMVPIGFIFAVTVSSAIFFIGSGKAFLLHPQVVLEDTVLNATTLGKPSDDLWKLQHQIVDANKGKDIHLSYYGYTEPMPLDPALKDAFQPWLPSPIALILSPETKDAVVKALAHSKLFQSNDGYVIIDVKNSDKTVVAYLLELLRMWKNCNVTIHVGDLDAYFCQAK